MVFSSWSNNIVKTLLCAALGVAACVGCDPGQYKAQADEEVYEILDQKWQEDIGVRANSRISDVEADVDDVSVDVKLPESGILSLAEAVALATAHNRDYLRRKEDLDLSALDLSLVRHNFNLRFFGLLDGGYTRTQADGSIDGGGQVGFNQLLADGAVISTTLAVDWVRFLTGGPRASLGSVLTGSFVQPLLRGSGRKIVQENLTQAERNTFYQIRSFGRFRKSFVVGIVSDYYSVLQALDRVRNARANYDRRVEATQQSAMLADAGVIPRLQLDQDKQSELLAQDQVVRSEQSYEQQLDQFKISLALSADVELQLDPKELEALAGAGIVEAEISLEEAVEAAVTQRLDLANLQDQVKDAERKIDVAADNLAVALNLIGSASVESDGARRSTRLLFEDGRYSVGLELNPDLDRKAERNAYREALISLPRARRSYDLQRDMVKLDVRQARRQLREASQRYVIQQESLNLAETRVDSSKLLRLAGRATSRDLRESQDSLLAAQNGVTDALVNHTISKLNFYRDIGVLQVKADGLWETKP